MGSGASKPPPNFVQAVEKDELVQAQKETSKWRVYSEYLDFVSMTLETPSIGKSDKKEELNIGRQVYSDVMLTSSTVSGTHGMAVFDKDRRVWQYKDTGSSTGSILLMGDTNKKLETNELVPLGVNCALRLGRAIVTVLSDRIRPEIRISCIAGEHKDENWELKSFRKSLTFGSDKRSVVRFISSDEVCNKHLRILKFNGWWAMLPLDSKATTSINGFKAKVNELVFLWVGAVIKLGSSGKEKFVVEAALK